MFTSIAKGVNSQRCREMLGLEVDALPTTRTGQSTVQSWHPPLARKLQYRTMWCSSYTLKWASPRGIPYPTSVDTNGRLGASAQGYRQH